MNKVAERSDLIIGRSTLDVRCSSFNIYKRSEPWLEGKANRIKPGPEDQVYVMQ